MTIQFFGQFLLQRGKISREQLLGALRIQQDHNLPLGMLAVRRGLMTEEQAEQVNRQQQSRDAQFGQLARELGFLTEDQVGEVVAEQQAGWIKIGEALVQGEHISEDDLNRELAEFQQAQTSGQEQLQQVLTAAGDREILEVFADVTGKLLLRMARVHVKLGDLVILDGGYPDPRGYDVRQDLTGDRSLCYSLNVSQELVLYLASKLFRREMTEVSADALDAVGELINIITGNSCARLSAQGIRLEPDPPVARRNDDEGAAPQNKAWGSQLSFLSPAGDFELLLLSPQ